MKVSKFRSVHFRKTLKMDKSKLNISTPNLEFSTLRQPNQVCKRKRMKRSQSMPSICSTVKAGKHEQGYKQNR